MSTPKEYGNFIIGIWRCVPCKFEIFPRHLMLAEKKPPFTCPHCQRELIYDEEA